MVKVLHVGTEWVPIPPITGGALEIWVLEVSKKLREMGWEVSIVSAYDPSLPLYEIIDNIDIHRIPTFFKQRQPLEKYLGHSVFCLFASLKATMLNVDLVHVQNVYRMLPVLKIMRRNIPTVISVQNEPLLRHISTFCYKMADAIHVPSRFMRSSLITNSKVEPTKISVIYNGVDLGLFNPKNTGNFREEIQVGTDPMVLYVGRISPIKGVQFLIQAIQRVQKRCPKAKFVFVGPCAYGVGYKSNAFYRHFVKSFAGDENIIYLGLITDRNKLAQLYAGADIFVLPSIWQDPSPMVVVEAMASGLPVIASNVGGIPEMVKDWENGLLVPPRDPEALAEAVEFLLENDDVRETMGLKSRSEAERRFSWDTVAKKILQVYEKIL